MWGQNLILDNVESWCVVSTLFERFITGFPAHRRVLDLCPGGVFLPPSRFPLLFPCCPFFDWRLVELPWLLNFPEESESLRRSLSAVVVSE